MIKSIIFIAAAIVLATPQLVKAKEYWEQYNDLSIYNTQDNLEVIVNNKTKIACSFNYKAGSVVQLTNARLEKSYMQGSYLWGTLSGNLDSYLDRKSFKISKVKGKFTAKDSSLVKPMHYKSDVRTPPQIANTCAKKDGLNSVRKILMSNTSR